MTLFVEASTEGSMSFAAGYMTDKLVRSVERNKGEGREMVVWEGREYERQGPKDKMRTDDDEAGDS